jgi:nucleotide-binding universal stress UspA family protein
VKRYKRVMVGLDLSAIDPSLIRYAAMLSRHTRAEKVYFIHVPNDLDLPAMVRVEHQQAWEQAVLRIRMRLREAVNAHFQGYAGTETICEVVAGQPVAELLQRVRDQDIHLILVGKKGGEQGTSTLPVKLVRKAPCSVLIVPSHTPPRITSILVPVDFSEPAADAMEVALMLGRNIGATPVLCQHVYTIPTWYPGPGAGRTYEGFAADLKWRVQRAYQGFLARFDLHNVSVQAVLTLHTRPATAIKETATTQNVDLIVMGTRGKSAVAAVLLGSAVEKIIRTINLPLLIVKRQAEHTRLSEFLQHILPRQSAPYIPDFTPPHMAERCRDRCRRTEMSTYDRCAVTIPHLLALRDHRR